MQRYARRVSDAAPLHPDASPGLLLWRVTLRWKREITAALAPLDLTHAQFVLLASAWWLGTHAEEPPTQRVLADHAATDPMMTSQVLRALEQRGLVDRMPDPRDARARRIIVTERGAELAPRAIAAVEAADAAFFSAADRADVLAVLHRLDSA